MIPIAKPIITEKEKSAVLSVLDSGMLTQGKKVEELELSLAKYSGVNHAIALSSGTAALHTALMAAGIKPGDEVITTPFTFVATANAILMCGAIPVFADIDESTFNLSNSEVEKRITPKTKAILSVDLYGLPADYASLGKIAEKHSLKLIADACQSIGASHNGSKSGSLADISVFSLYATKNAMCGEGGIITTDSSDVALFAKKFRHHGQHPERQYSYEFLGYNYRMTDIHAAIAVEQLKSIDEWASKRNRNAALLNNLLKSTDGITTPKVPESATHSFHQYTIRVHKNRDGLQKFLLSNGIGCKVFYPTPLHKEPHLAQYNGIFSFPTAERACAEVLSIPVHPLVTEDNIRYIAEKINFWTEKNTQHPHLPTKSF